MGAGTPAGHAHGSMSLMEAIREAIFSEVSAAEFPNEAVPIIAIIDTGLSFSSPDASDVYDQDVRRAIAIRPTAIRIAHAERAPLFKQSVTGFQNVQAHDAERVSDVIAAWMDSEMALSKLDSEVTVLQRLFSAMVEQIVFGQVHRLFCGGFFSSNVTISGGFLDFGNMHALPDWSRSQVHSVVEGAGAEMPLVETIIKSLSFYVAKYRRTGKGAQLDGDFYAAIDQAYLDNWKMRSAQLFQLEDTPEQVKLPLYRILSNYYLAQQGIRNKYRFGKIVATTQRGSPSWIHAGIVGGSRCAGGAMEAAVLKQLDSHLRRYLSARKRRIAWHSAARLLSPRQALDRHTLLAELHSLTTAKKPAPNRKEIAEYIDAKVNEGRRFWKHLPEESIVLGQVARGGSTAVLLEGGNTRPTLWVEGVTGSGNILSMFDERLNEEECRALRLRNHGPSWSGIVQADEAEDGYCFHVLGRPIHVPSMTLTYQAPSEEWLA